MGEAGDLGTLAEFLADDVARAVLAETSVEPMTVNELAERVDASKPTIYRRVQRLEDHGLLEATVEPDVDGHHEKAFAASFDRLTVDLDDGSYAYDLRRTEPMADRLTRFVEQL